MNLPFNVFDVDPNMASGRAQTNRPTSKEDHRREWRATPNKFKCNPLYLPRSIGGRGLKGLGHAILGNFSIDQMVIELTEITK